MGYKVGDIVKGVKLIKLIPRSKSDRYTKWLVEYSWGERKIIRQDYFPRLAKRDRKKIAPLDGIFRTYKSQARRRNLEWCLTIDEFKNITQLDCFYCGEKPSNKAWRQRYYRGPDYIYNGIDRKDNNLGYEHGNVLPCCRTCNRMKSNYSYDDFLKKIHNIYKHIFKVARP
jgi:hypothetical protein